MPASMGYINAIKGWCQKGQQVIKSRSYTNNSNSSSAEITATDGDEQKWYKQTENLMKILQKNASHVLPSRWYHDEEVLCKF